MDPPDGEQVRYKYRTEPGSAARNLRRAIASADYDWRIPRNVAAIDFLPLLPDLVLLTIAAHPLIASLTPIAARPMLKMQVLRIQVSEVVSHEHLSSTGFWGTRPWRGRRRATH
jgi:hypothetical protein